MEAAVPDTIRIGVTGHRNIPEPLALRSTVRKAIEKEIPNLALDNSPQFQLRILSPLAEGADRVVAQAVLECPGAQLQAVLPLVVEDYLEDFATEESRKEFRELLALSSHPVWLRTRHIAEESPEPGTQSRLRLDAYRRVGHYVVDHCDLLIAIWDGLPARGRGGTADIVQYALDRHRRVLRVWQDSFEALNLKQ
jgi:hypothetical protein